MTQIIVVDNDASGSARTTVESVAASCKWPIRYEIEPQRGISFARNRGVALAAGCEYVAFVDDDEVVAPSWLDELLSCRASFDADAVAGPVLSIFESPPPPWVVKGRFFDRPRRLTGTTLEFTNAGNVLVKRRILDWIDGPFDPRFALSGGEDTLLFMQLVRSGARLVWCDEAIVEECVPSTRVNARWILRRAYRGGNSIALCERATGATVRARALRATKGVARTCEGLVRLGPAVLRHGRAGALHSLARIGLGLGMVSGVMGRRFEEYRDISGN